MKCPKCNDDHLSVKAVESDHDESTIEIIAECPDCDYNGYTFVELDTFVSDQI